jgi:hypothetical protein
VPIIDERGRVFGRLNAVDAGVTLIALLLLMGLAAGVRIFRLPPAPIVTVTEPATQIGGNGLKLRLTGQNFLPYYRVFIRRAGQSARQVHEENPDLHNDAYTLVNHTQAVFVAESATTAELRLPDDMGAGTYDLMFFNETQQVGIKAEAFSVTEPPARPKPPPLPTVWLRAVGAFIALEPADAARLVAGLKLPVLDPAPWIEILSVEAPQPSVGRVTAASGTVAAQIEGKVDVPVTVRIRCTLLMGFCNVGTLNMVSQVTIPIRLLQDRAVNLYLDEVLPDVPERLGEAQVDVRFVTRPDVGALMHPGQTDSVAPARYGRANGAAVIVSLGASELVNGRSQPNLSELDPGGSATVGERVMTRRAVLRLPVRDVAGTWYYHGQPIKSGATITFSTGAYVLRGWILDMRMTAAVAR